MKKAELYLNGEYVGILFYEEANVTKHDDETTYDLKAYGRWQVIHAKDGLTVKLPDEPTTITANLIHQPSTLEINRSKLLPENENLLLDLSNERSMETRHCNIDSNPFHNRSIYLSPKYNWILASDPFNGEPLLIPLLK